MRRTTRSAGFTLIELLTVIAIIGLVMAAALGVSWALLKEAPLSSRADALSRLLAEGRGWAVGNRQAATLSVDLDLDPRRARLERVSPAEVVSELTLDARFTFVLPDAERKFSLRLGPDGRLKALGADRSSVAFDDDPAGNFDLAIEDLDAGVVCYLDIVGSSGIIRRSLEGK